MMRPGLEPYDKQGQHTMKTLSELEQENPEGFRNPTRTPEQEAASAQIRAAKRAYEDANTPTEITPEDEDQDEDNTQ